MDKFSYEANGYNKAEVRSFVNDVYLQTKGIIEEAERQRTEIQKLKEELKHFQNMEDSLKHSILNAQETGDNIKRMARVESKNIVEDAKSNANRIVNDALIRAEEVEIKAATLERNIRIYKKKLKLIVEQQLAVVDEIEELDLN